VVLVDFENLVWGLKREFRLADPDCVDLAVGALRGLRRTLTMGQRIIIGRAYADWRPRGLTGALQPLSLMGLHPEYVFAKCGKGSTDLALSLDAQEILLTRLEIERFVIVGGDRDYLAVARRILERGRAITVPRRDHARRERWRRTLGGGDPASAR
jgi:hypothetical protein